MGQTQSPSLEETARAVWEVASQKGMLHATDPETGSDALVGFFVPAHEMNQLGKALVAEKGKADRITKALVELYKSDRVGVARVCDEIIDRSGALLGEIRKLAMQAENVDESLPHRPCWPPHAGMAHGPHNYNKREGGTTVRYYCPGMTYDRT